MAEHLVSVKPFGNGLALDVGTGSGIQAMVLAGNGWKVFAADIDSPAVREAFSNASGNGLSVFFSVGDLMSHLRARFSLIAFNPPYLIPSGTDFPGRHWLEAGEGLFREFFRQARERICEGGIVLLIHSSNGPDAAAIGTEQGFSHRVVATRKLFFESLFLSEFRLL